MSELYGRMMVQGDCSTTTHSVETRGKKPRGCFGDVSGGFINFLVPFFHSSPLPSQEGYCPHWDCVSSCEPCLARPTHAIHPALSEDVGEGEGEAAGIMEAELQPVRNCLLSSWPRWMQHTVGLLIIRLLLTHMYQARLLAAIMKGRHGRRFARPQGGIEEADHPLEDQRQPHTHPIELSHRQSSQ